MDRQRRLEFKQDTTTAVLLEAEVRERLIVLMAEAIGKIVEQTKGGEDDERSGILSQD